jgi:hypothetical protein
MMSDRDREPRDDDAFGHRPRHRFHVADEGGSTDDGGPSAHAGAFPDDTTYHLADDAEAERHAPASAGRGIVGLLLFFLLMAAIGSSGGALWFYFGPQLEIGGTQVESTAQSLNRLAEEQRKLVQSIAALQLAQDALAKLIAAREQEMQQLLTETRSLRTDLDGLRAAAAAPPRPSNAQPKAPAKKKTERKSTAEPKSEAPPMAVSPQPQ